MKWIELTFKNVNNHYWTTFSQFYFQKSPLRLGGKTVGQSWQHPPVLWERCIGPALKNFAIVIVRCCCRTLALSRISSHFNEYIREIYDVAWGSLKNESVNTVKIVELTIELSSNIEHPNLQTNRLKHVGKFFSGYGFLYFRRD